VRNVPRGWVISDIISVTSHVTDGTHAPPRSERDGIPLLSAKNITDHGLAAHGTRFVTREYFEAETERTRLAEGDVLLTIVGSIGRSAIVPANPQFAFQRSVAILKPLGVTGKYLSFYLRSPEAANYYAKRARGTAQLGLYLRDLKQLPVPVAPVAEQDRIVAAIEEQFSRLDAGVVALQRVRENTKRMRAAVLESAVSGHLVQQESAEGTGSDLAAMIAKRRGGAKPSAAPSAGLAVPDTWRVMQNVP
jgi:type I restriction enzyme S subunit